MLITIIGWYGTETIGDRAILAGLISLLNKSFGTFGLKIGSLYPFFTERTVNEDYALYREQIGRDLQIEIFNSTKKKELVSAIRSSDLLVMGGGPLMDLYELSLIDYAFKHARKLGVRTVLCGCGIGPLFQKRFQKIVLNIVRKSDLVILRDAISKERLSQIFRQFSGNWKLDSILTSLDPAVECALAFNKLSKDKSDDRRIIAVDRESSEKAYIAVNLRDFPSEYSSSTSSKRINEALTGFIEQIATKYSSYEIRLVPMHYFHIGGDDRFFLNQIALQSRMDNIVVQNSHLDLRDTMKTFKSAAVNIGMRFHAVVLQTIIAGNNYVLDYTEPKIGKISGFLDSIDKTKFYSDRYVAIQATSFDGSLITRATDRFRPDDRVFEGLNIYVTALKSLP